MDHPALHTIACWLLPSVRGKTAGRNASFILTMFLHLIGVLFAPAVASVLMFLCVCIYSR